MSYQTMGNAASMGDQTITSNHKTDKARAWHYYSMAMMRLAHNLREEGKDGDQAEQLAFVLDSYSIEDDS